MKKKRKCGFIILMALISCWSIAGCGKVHGDDTTIEKEQLLNWTDAEEIRWENGKTGEREALRKVASIEKKDTESQNDTECRVEACRWTGKDTIYLVSYSHEMEQYTFRNEIFLNQEGEKSLLYETEEAFWVNELECNEKLAFWVEYVSLGDEVQYQIKCMDFEKRNVMCIATYPASEVEEICLSVSKNYVTWYESKINGGSSLRIYDINANQILQEQDKAVKKYAPYERVDIVDNGITYLEQRENRVFLIRYDLLTKEETKICLGEEADDKRITGCFSTKDWLGWFTDYSGTYYFSGTQDDKILRLTGDTKHNVFSFCLSDCLYINSMNTLYRYDFETKEMETYVLPGIGLQFHRTEKNQIYIEVNEGDEMALYEL